MRLVILPAVLLLAACSGTTPDTGDSQPTSTRVTRTLLHTSDEHGWLVPPTELGTTYGGPAVMRAMWTEREAATPDTHLILTGGDSALGGAAISQWFEGRPAIEVMNAMGYQVAAVGNHELDLGQAVFEARADQSDFPWLAVNIDDAEGPYVDGTALFELDGIEVGVLGLANRDMVELVLATATEGLTFPAPSARIDAAAASLREQGADVVVVLTHECAAAAGDLLPTLTEPVDVWFGAHCHAQANTEVAGVPVVASGRWWEGYSRVDLTFEEGALIDASASFQTVSWPSAGTPLAEPDADVQALVDTWAAAVDAELSEVIGYTDTGVVRGWRMANWLTDSWLTSGDADFALFNASLRADVAPGEISLEDIVNVLPFENDLVTLEVSGATLQAHLATTSEPPYVAGFSYTVQDQQAQITPVDRAAFDPSATYVVIVTDFEAYNTGRPYLAWDPTPTPTGTHYRDPLIAWTRALGSSATDPLEAHLDGTPRGPRAR
ncbi:MAG: bifunctional metallophosphatase/5'-nucleotidase [Deltaproteobacteria bacterium]|nr:MAG: bifunctional metallophosphatase/5'-nucleotidase [Deltaproteobacteria bacterium]